MKELPSFANGMCYIIKHKQSFVFESITVTIEKKNVDIGDLKVWLTSNYDFLRAIQEGNDPFLYKFNVPFGGIYSTRITFKETIFKALNCKLSDIGYVSDQQCLVNIFINEHFSACPFKCLTIQMKGFQYVNQSTNFINCARLEHEICNGGFEVWTPLLNKFSDCPKPCKITTFKDSQLDLKEPLFLKTGKTLANFELEANKIRSIEKEVLVYDLNDVIGAVGGSLGLFLGFSFFDVISKSLDNLFIPLVNYLISSRVVEDQSMTLA